MLIRSLQLVDNHVTRLSSESNEKCAGIQHMLVQKHMRRDAVFFQCASFEGESTLVQIGIWNCEEEKAEHLIA